MLFHSNDIMIRFGFAVLSFLLMATVSFGDITSEDMAFLDDLQKRGVRFFWEEANPANGLIYDRARFDGSDGSPDRVASIASVGFGLVALCIGQERGWIDPADAYERVRTTLLYLRDDMPNVRGFYYHFVDISTGERAWNSELSSIDTALLIAGVLTVRQYYEGTEIERLATDIYERVEWPWMLRNGLFSMGWKPESGFLPYHWNNYSEHLILYLLAMGSPTHPIPTEIWHNWRRSPFINYGDRAFLACPPLFTHQYSQSWIDFRDKRDAYADYHLNTILATRAQRRMFMDLTPVYPAYGEDVWGLTASDYPGGYVAWGGPPETRIDGTVTPYAAGGAIAFTPNEAVHTLRHMHKEYGHVIWGDYAFSVAFNPHTDWMSDYVIGIDIGVTVLSAENHRTGFVWDLFMRNPEIQLAMERAGFVDTTPALTDADRQYLEDLAADTWRSIESLVHEESGLPFNDRSRRGMTSLGHIGLHLTALVAAHEFGLITRDEAVQRITRMLESIHRFRTWRGFPANWNHLDTLEPSGTNPWISPAAAGYLAAGLITAARAFPETEYAAQSLLDAMQWEAFLNDDRSALHGGYNPITETFHDEWMLSSLAADSRMGVFMALASGRVPENLWDRLDRTPKNRYHVEYLKPGWDGGGLFMAFMSGLWLDESGTMAFQSARNFAYAQIRHAAELGMPVWGWSASDSPRDGFLGAGRLRDAIVTPHASLLALEHYPVPVLANLRRLEQMGMRHAEWGFYEALDVQTGRRTDNIMHRHQCMSLITLANYLKDDVIRNFFESNITILEGRHRVRELRDTPFNGNRSVYTLQYTPLDIR